MNKPIMFQPKLITLSPYLISLQRLAHEARLSGYSGLARGAEGMLVQDFLKAWMDDRVYESKPHQSATYHEGSLSEDCRA